MDQPGEGARPDSGRETARAASAPDPLEAELSPAEDRIVVTEWSRRIPPIMAWVPHMRIGKRWFNILWLLPIGVVLLIAGIAVAQQLRTYPAVQQFIHTYPGQGSFQPPVTLGFPLWLRILHFLNLLFIAFIIRAGIQILADHPRLQVDAGSTPGREWLRLRGPVPPDRMKQEPPERAWTAKDDAVTLPRWLGLPGIRHSIGLARWWHFSCDLLWLVNGVAFYVLLFTTGQWARLVPRNWDVIPNAASTALQYLSLDFPTNEGWTQYNGMQILVYFLAVFIAAPLAFITGLLQAPAIAARFGLGWGRINRQVARCVHFAVLTFFVLFILVHTVMVYITGLLVNLNHITTGMNTAAWAGLWLYVIWMVIVVALWWAASPLTLRYPRVVQKTGRLLVGWAKGLLEWRDARATYPERAVSSFFWPNGTLPTSQVYATLRDNGFRDYTLRVDGLVEHPVVLSYDQLKAMPRQEQITQHYCIQGWSGVAKWGGVPMRDIVALVRPSPQARWVVFYSFAAGTEGGRYYDAHKIEHMRHHLTILAYEMNGEPLNVLHGAPLRLRNELELGFKMVKWIEAIEFVESFEHLGAGQGGYNEDHEFYGYRMPI
ncbi:molybdopterin-dependent oxidoreductase [Kutzneria sp. CA-103260]|uniref:molybdopterin-dependent oxidoreductase n=1 Tax=Kutzneria sp. CA-103260 TaxID=2802641 RepID=UPI001BA98594|nr:molybdopterin-dependent oxidoreductase [Kutzneria sp. CA-103260]QUQ68864.1 Protein-methionine-sulfoxide reductase catalytic subunit MsrP [Kutzneria sp. CA-103260]